jgi:hypothetical protein
MHYANRQPVALYVVISTGNRGVTLMLGLRKSLL